MIVVLDLVHQAMKKSAKVVVILLVLVLNLHGGLGRAYQRMGMPKTLIGSMRE